MTPNPNTPTVSAEGTSMYRIPALAAAIAGMLLAPSPSRAPDFQEGRYRNCGRAEICELKFAGPGPGQTLRLRHVICRLTTSRAIESWRIELFDDNNALYVPAFQQSLNVSVASAPVDFLTGGSNIIITAFLEDVTRSQLACTLSGEVS